MPAAARQLADGAPRLLVDPGREEALEPAPLGVEYPDRGIARARELASRLEDALQDRLAVQLGDDRCADLEQEAEPPLIESATVHAPAPTVAQTARSGQARDLRRPFEAREVPA